MQHSCVASAILICCCYCCCLFLGSNAFVVHTGRSLGTREATHRGGGKSSSSSRSSSRGGGGGGWTFRGIHHGHLMSSLQPDAGATAAAEAEGQEWRSEEGEGEEMVQQICFQLNCVDAVPLSELLLETGALGVEVADAARGTERETPIFDEMNSSWIYDSLSSLNQTTTVDATTAIGDEKFSGLRKTSSPSASAVIGDDALQVEIRSRAKLWTNSSVTALFPASFDMEVVVEQLTEAFDLQENLEYEVATVPKGVDWQLQVQEDWDPIDVGAVTIYFPWHDRPTEEDGKLGLVLEGGRAFGTGEHPTTALCCLWLQEQLEQQALDAAVGDTADAASRTRVLDYGSGSAILGLAALKLGASEAVGVEIDIGAILSAIQNCKSNKLHMDFFHPEEKADGGLEMVPVAVAEDGADSDYSEGPPVELKPFPIVVANILSVCLTGLEPQMYAMTEKGGRIAMSGILEEHADNVLQAYRERFDVSVTARKDGWVLISGVRR